MPTNKKIIKKKVIRKKVVKKAVKKKITKKKPARIHTVKISDIVTPSYDEFNLYDIGTTQSILGAFQTCKRRCLYILNRWIKIRGEAVFEFGNIYHEMLDQSFQVGKPFSNRVLSNRLNKYCTKRENEIDPSLIDDLHLKIDMAEMILQEYFKYYPEDFTEKIVIAPEQLFRVKFGDYTLLGKKDLRFCFKKKPKQIWNMEHKTKGRVDADILEGVLNFDLQNLFYITADDLEYDDNIQHVLYNIIRNPGIKKWVKETYKQFVERIRADIQSRPDFYFIRYECPYTMNTKKNFKAELKSKLDLFQDFLDGKYMWFKNECACKTPFRCQYLEMCASGNTVGYQQQEKLFPELEDSHYT